MKTDKIAWKFPWNSPYAFAENSPIAAIDLDGKEIFVIIYATNENSTGHVMIAVPTYKEVGKNNDGSTKYERTGFRIYSNSNHFGADGKRYSGNNDIFYKNYTNDEFFARYGSGGAETVDGLIELTGMKTDDYINNQYSGPEVQIGKDFADFVKQDAKNETRTFGLDKGDFNCTTYLAGLLNKGLGITDKSGNDIGTTDIGDITGAADEDLYYNPNELGLDLIDKKNTVTKGGKTNFTKIIFDKQTLTREDFKKHAETFE